MKKSTTVLVPCFISKGMFPDEYAVEIKLSSGQIISLFAERSDLENIDLEHGTANLKVSLVDNQSEDTEREILMYLPKESLETGSRWFKLPAGKVLQVK